MDLSAEKSDDKGFGETSGQRMREKVDNPTESIDRSIDELEREAYPPVRLRILRP